MQQRAFLFDLNGTMIDDMSYHIRAWHRIFNELGAPLSLEQAKLECYGKNHEVLERVFPGRFKDEEKDKMSIDKEKQYQLEYAPEMKLIDGLQEFLDTAYKNGIKMAIGSAAIMFNIDFVLEGLNIRHYFDSIVSADDVAISKPHPETYLRCAEQLNVSPENCIVFEDSPKGVEAAARAGMQAVVLTTMHDAEDFKGLDNILFIVTDYTDPAIAQLSPIKKEIAVK
ncbi:MAG: HAD family phosphatase [Chitinophagaceae bacterium]